MFWSDSSGVLNKKAVFDRMNPDSIDVRQKIAAEELGMEDSTFNDHLDALQQLLPGVGNRLLKMPPKLIAALVSMAPEIAGTLVQLKSILPQVGAMH